MACNVAANNFAHRLVGPSAMKDNMIFGRYAADGKLVDGGDIADDAIGELREEEIVWGEAEVHHQQKDCGHGKGSTKINHGGHPAIGYPVIRHRSLLTRQMEMQANTWAPGSKLSTVLVVKQSGKGDAHIKAAPDHKDYEVKVGGCEEEGGAQQHMDEIIPPHELLARQNAASTTTSFSVLQGAGRTLKGMDLRRLRNEVWRQTGYVD